MSYALDIRDLRKTFPGGLEALKGIDLQVEAGDFFALLGPNGAGKSTTLGVLASLVRKTSGQVRVFDADLDTNPARLKTWLGFVPQEFNFNQFEKVGDIVRTQAGYYGMAPGRAARNAEHYLRELGLWDKRDSPARMLSGGMKRRLLIARALVHEPRVLILDEPTAGVDIELRRSMWGFLERINREGVTIILTTHYLEEAEALCRNIAIIDGGRILQNTSKQALLQQLSMEHFILDIRNDPGTVPPLEGYECFRNDEGALVVEVERDDGLNDVFRQLGDLGWEVTSMRNRSNRLEELFMSLVGRALPDSEEEASA
ncbi:ABC transporter ATP-binding protein [Halomonadaceae bacterium KBTZ08]